MGGSYNGFAWSQRAKAYAWLKAEWNAGRRARHGPACDVCQTTTGFLMAHSESYAAPYGDHIGQWTLCYWCHMLLHCRFRAPARFAAYVAMLESGERFVNGPVAQWSSVQAYLAGRSEPARERIAAPRTNPYGPVFARSGQTTVPESTRPLTSRSVGCESSAAVTGPRAVGYRRVSTQDQANSGLGLEAQTTAIETAVARLGLTLCQTFTDAGLSGGLALEQRPALLNAIDLLRTGDVLVVAKRDRLGRDVLNVAMIERLVERRGARVHSAAGEGSDDDGPTGRLMRQIIDCFAQYERELIRARTRAAMAAAKVRGQRVGHLPFGQQLADDGRTLVPNQGEQQTLALVRRLRRLGYAQADIATELNRLGFRTRRGGLFQRSFVAQLLQRHALVS